MIDPSAVIARLRETDARSGGRRVAWTPEWADERTRTDELVRAIVPGVVVESDAFANRWYVLPGAGTETVLLGSHSDCVPGGGWLDGILGVHAAIEALSAVARRAAEDGAPPARTLAVVDWADEEGARFGRSLLGSGAATGALARAELDALRDGPTPALEILEAYGFDAGALGTRTPRLDDVIAALELHIEQGPVLASEGRAVAAVAGCLGVRRLRLVLTGDAGHAGATPMPARHDPVRAAAETIAAISAAAESAGGLATVGVVSAEPAIPTAIAERCAFTLDLRHADAGALEALEERALEAVGGAARTHGCRDGHETLWAIPPVHFDERLTARAVAAAGGSDPLVSGPLHDSAALAQAGIPTTMLFAPSIDGISHARSEDTAEEDLVVAVGVFCELVAELVG